MSASLCCLCVLRTPIENSHVIPSLVTRAIRKDSPTGFFRNPNNPDHRLQDSDKHAILCEECEQRFSGPEGEFAKRVFLPFHHLDTDRFSYGPWLHYFMTSVAWRTLILDLPGLKADPKNPRHTVESLETAAELMRLYLLGASNLATQFNAHLFVSTIGQTKNPRLAAAKPNVMIRRSTFGYTILDRTHGYSAVLHNLAGLMCFLIVKGNPCDSWRGTKIGPLGGNVNQPQEVKSWLIGHFLQFVIDASEKQMNMSDRQQEKVLASVRNPQTPAFRIWRADARFKDAGEK